MLYRLDKNVIFDVSGWRTIGWLGASVIGFLAQGLCAGSMIMFFTLFVFGKLENEWKLVETNSETVLDTFRDSEFGTEMWMSLSHDHVKEDAPEPHEVGFASYYQNKKKQIRQAREVGEILEVWNNSSLS